MRISTITNWAYGATVALTLVSGAAFLLAGQAWQAERAALESRLDHDRAVEMLVAADGTLGDSARGFAMHRDPRHAATFRHELTDARRRERAIERLDELGAPTSEKDALVDLDRASRALRSVEMEAITAIERGDVAYGQARLFDENYAADQEALVAAARRFERQVDERTGRALVAAQAQADRLTLIARIMLAITAALFLGVLYFVVSRRIARPLVRMSGVVSRLAEQDYAVEMPEDGRRDEIGDMAQAIRVFRENGLERERLETERARDQVVRDALAQMMHRMQGCDTQEELAEVVACFAPQVFPELTGALFAFDPTRNLLIDLGRWGEPHRTETTFVPARCWGLRRGRPHVSNGGRHDIACPHLQDLDASDSLCVPLVAQGETVGLLYFEEISKEPDRDRNAPRIYLEIMAENVGLALANIGLRQTLRTLAIRDPLTGLYNRRFLDETLNRELEQARRTGAPLSCIMIDIDHFKRFNDDHGHDAGDAVLQRVAQIIARHSGPADHPCRFGGEEFALVLPATDLAGATARAEEMRVAVRDIAIAHHGRPLGPITASFGVAELPPRANATVLLQLADAALLEAKREGRDRVVTDEAGRAAA